MEFRTHLNQYNFILILLHLQRSDFQTSHMDRFWVVMNLGDTQFNQYTSIDNNSETSILFQHKNRSYEIVQVRKHFKVHLIRITYLSVIFPTRIKKSMVYEYLTYTCQLFGNPNNLGLRSSIDVPTGFVYSAFPFFSTYPLNGKHRTEKFLTFF